MDTTVTVEIDQDSLAFVRAGHLLRRNRACSHVEVWEADRLVMARHRDEPFLRGFTPAAEPDV